MTTPALPPLPLNRDLAFAYGTMTALSPLVRRLVCRNPSPFTFHGTGTYVIGRGRVAVIDPGPLDADHVAALRAGLSGETITHLLITHTHNDHSPAVRLLRPHTDATTYGYGPHGSGHDDGGPKIEEGGDRTFTPDVAVRDGDVIAGDGWTVRCVFTPGHTSNHVCFALEDERALFTGDHVMGWSTTVIGPPDGDMAAYMASLRKLLARDDAVYYPTHGSPIGGPYDTQNRRPQEFVRALIDHRLAREAQIAGQLADGPKRIPEIVAVLYADVDKRLHAAAGLSVLAHLRGLAAQGRAAESGGVWRRT